MEQIYSSYNQYMYKIILTCSLSDPERTSLAKQLRSGRDAE